MVIYGTEYAGEMKKGVLTLMMYEMVLRGHLPLHSSANVDNQGNVSLFFGLSGTGKTTLSADSNRYLIGDDEHVWTETGIFNIEGGCYAKCIGLDSMKEPDIYKAIRYGSVLENVILTSTRDVDYNDYSITENTRVAYPLNYIDKVKIPAIGNHPQHIILLTCDGLGLLPPVAKLTPDQAVFMFICGYTSKIPGTEVGIKEVTPIFSSCFGEPFLVWSPQQYGDLLKQKLIDHPTQVWMVNTGWIGGAYGQGKRISIQWTRSIIDAIHQSTLTDYITFPYFNFQIPQTCPNVPSSILNPLLTSDPTYPDKLHKLYELFLNTYDQKIN
jgi:phosphoenolpyruvate carboxykinase (ATP)